MEFLKEAAKTIGGRISEGSTLAFLILTLALIIGPRVAERLRLPAMVGLVLAGMAVGPHAFGILDTKGIALTAIGNFGLLYLMFAAGLELDLKLFMREKKAALTFAVTSFIVPFSLGIMSARLLHYAWAGAVLMGSNWGSHTLVTYPILRSMGLARNRAVGTVVGATTVTDTSALLVLTGVVASTQKSSSVGGQAAEIAVGLGFLVFFALVVLPRIAKWFFAQVGTQSSYRLVFGIVAFLLCAVIAKAASIDGIVGAFFAGLGMNRAIPERSELMDRIQFFGSSLFIPIFLASVGVLIEPKVLIDPKTLLIALVFTIAVLGGKALAAVITGRVFKFTWPEIGVMSGLSGSQAAATLATTLIGAKLKIFDAQTINAVLVVILASMVITPATVTFFAKRVPRRPGQTDAIGSAVLVPVWGESTRPLLGVAGKLAAADGGVVLAATIASDSAPNTELAAQRALKDQAQEWLAKDGLEAQTLFRTSRSVAAGLLQTVRGENASMLLAEWRDPSVPELGGDDEAFGLLSRSPVPIVLAHGDVEHFDRVVVLAREEDRIRTENHDLGIATEVATRLGHHHGHHVACVGPGAPKTLFAPKLHVDRIESADPIGWVRDHATPNDVMVFSGLEAARDALARIPGLAKMRFLVAIATHGAPFQEQPAGAGGSMVVGRSTTQAAA